MTRTLSRLFDNYTEAMAAVEDLEQAGIEANDISLIANNADNWHTGHRHETASIGDADGDGDNDVAVGAGKGAVTGGALGAGAGLLAGLGILAIPGIGAVAAAGWLASTAIGAVVGAAAGGATGGLLGALKESGHTDDEAHVYSEGVRRGGALVSVKAEEDEIRRVEQILDGRGGVDAATRGRLYRQTGWSQFDEQAPPYSSEEIARERRLYREERSFAAGEPTDRTIPDEPSDRNLGGAPTAPGRDF